MKARIIILASIAFIAFTSFTNLSEWGPTGHRTTGKIAEKHLTKKARKKIDKILKGESLAFVSTFGDQIKSDRKYSKFYPWHYVNMSLDGNYETSEKNPKGDLVTGIDYCIKVLKDKNSSEEDQAFYLKMLVHLMGDLHQPMHIGQKENKGGNTIQLRWFGKGTNLHRVWDEDMLNKWDMSYLELANNEKDLSKAQIEVIQEGSILDWVHETHKITKKVYASVKPGQKLSYRYSYLYFDIAREQLQKGGLRLAKVLNDIYCN